jgi:hypothetical protein
MIAGKDAQAARVDLHRLVDAELGAEVGHRARQPPLGCGPVPRVGAIVHVAAELVDDAAGVDHEVLVGRELGPPPVVHAGQHVDRVAMPSPRQVVDPREERLGARAPAPPQVPGQSCEALESARQVELVPGQHGHLHGGRHEG